ncbi:uncharacterized protein LOC136085236 [Hydra vulgaris]|uniref:Uncharacterized protein LOC136085236 n=1 Tax=Hydra vulgaris TaxID=6087 RepID=A0ABM4CLE2_HYDVU
MSKNNTFSPIEYAASISDLMNLTKKRLDKRKTIDEQNPADHNNSETSSKAGKTTYEYYSIEEETSKWICNQCNSNRPKKYSCKTSKSILDYHLEHDHKIITPKKKRTMSGLSKEVSDKIDRALLIFIIACCLPLMLVESSAFKEFVLCLNPKYKVPCRKKLRPLLTDLYREKVELLKSKLLSIKVLSITTDGWTSCQNYSYISATAHFISDKTNFISFCLGFAYLNGRHDADNLKEALLKIVEKFKVDDKIMSIVSDNASNVRNCLNSLKVCLNIQPIRCMGHVLQLVVKNVIDLVEEGEKDSSSKFFFIARTLTKCRKIVTSFNHSSQLKDFLEESQTRQGVEKNHILHLIQDMKTRWHSTFLMAERVVKLHSSVKDIFNSKQQYKDMRKYLLDEDEMVNLKETVNALLSFNQVSVLLSGDRYATCSLIIPSIKYLEKQLSKNKSETPPLILILKSHLLESLQTYKDLYELENNSFLLCATVGEIIPIKKVTKESKKFKLSFEDEEDDSGSDSDKNVTLDLKKENSEYIRLSVHEQNVLEFWHQNQYVFPILYCISTMILCTPATSAPSERLFSDALNNLYAKRNRMTAECFQMLMFLYENLEFFNLV